MKPLIGITSFINDRTQAAVNMAYVNAINAAGGAPVVLPPKAELAAEYLNALDGVLFSGGGDILGKYLGEPTHEKANDFSEERDAFELSLAKLAYEARKPVMGICRGEQIINVALGGGINQHMEGHKQSDPRNFATHAALTARGSMLRALLGSESVRVNSFHHQVVDRLGAGFVETARSEDGYIEAFEHRDMDGWFCLCVQWHPEALLESPEHVRQLELFRAFVGACAKEAAK